MGGAPMTIRFRPYFDSDFLRIRDFLSQSAREADGSPTRQPWNWWIDRWSFTATVSCAMHRTTHEEWAERLGLWEQWDAPTRTWQLLGLVLNEGERRGEAFIQSGCAELPAPVLEEMFDFIEAHTDTSGGVTLRLDPRFPQRMAIAERRGFARTDWQEPLSWLGVDAAPALALPPGYRLVEAHMVDVREKAALHARAFGYTDQPEFVQSAALAFARLPLTPDYRGDLDLLVLDAAGTPVAMAGFWYDAANRWGALEPLGTDPQHRRLGLARSLIGEGMRRMVQLAGARGERLDGMWVGSDQPFYLAVGFAVQNRWSVWQKALPR
ncbi:GNAT family N-acetyltransferase [Chloroflexia bacterium SDU3-3]|nr:GNAT family N-acetyltransferase [Chloroflexia bacterium SDU3-3]